VAATSEPARAASVRCTERSAPSDTALWSARTGGLGPHRHRDDLLDLDGAALLDLHGGLDGVGVVGVEVLLPAAVHATRRRVDPLLHGGIWHLFDEDTDLHLTASSGDERSGSYLID
jgi:hypothetical protein